MRSRRARLVTTMVLPTVLLLTVLPACHRTTGDGNDHSGAPHMRPAEQGAASAVYFTMRNPGAAPLIIYGVEIDVAGDASIHQSMDHNGMASMMRRDSVVVPANDSVAFAERGLHIMASNLVTALHVGDTVVARLLIRPSRIDTLRVPVRE
jgi:periplasmic copper chaperone A